MAHASSWSSNNFSKEKEQVNVVIITGGLLLILKFVKLIEIHESWSGHLR
jgi:hypothetical protein